MTTPGPPDTYAHGIPPEALPAWSALADALVHEGPGVCQTSDAEAWFPRTRQANAWEDRMAAAACTRCPVLVPCRAYALAADEPDGIWGGLTPAERSSLARPTAA